MADNLINTLDISFPPKGSGITEITSSQKTLLFILYFLSGISALTYEVLWTRMLSLHLGTTVYAASTVLGAFFAGMALGSMVFGRLADRIGNHFPVFALMELTIGLYALIFSDLLTVTSGIYVAIVRSIGVNIQLQMPINFLLVFLLLLIPATLMGGTYPVLLKGINRNQSDAAYHVSALYGANTAGAVCGAFLAGFVFLVNYGAAVTIILAACINCAIAVFTFLLMSVIGKRNTGQISPKDQVTADIPDILNKSDASKFLPSGLLAGSAIAGFCALGCEVLWTRTLVFFLGYTIYSFSTMLTTFLIGFSLGSWTVSLFIGRIRNRFLILAMVELTIGLLIAVSNLLFSFIPGLIRSIYGTAPELSLNLYLFAKFVSCALIMLPPTFFMGMAFPLFITLYVDSQSGQPGKKSQHTAQGLGTHSGRIIAANTIGGILGSLITGFFVIDWAGIHGGLAVICAGNTFIGMFLILGFTRMKRVYKSAVLAVSAGIVLLYLSLSHDAKPIIQLVKASGDMDLLFYREDATASISVIQERNRRLLVINSTAVSGYDTDLMKPELDLVNGHLPMLLHPYARHVLQIGTGAGMTLGTLGAYPVKSLTTIEICPAVVQASQFFQQQNFGILRDPRTRVIINDGRNQLLIDPTSYDVIINEAWLSMVTGATPLTSVEFFSLVKARLNPDGIYCFGPGLLDEYFKTELRTALFVFEYIYLFAFPDTGCFFALATLKPLRIDYMALTGKFNNTKISGLLRYINILSPNDLLSNFVCGPEMLRKYLGQGHINTDDLPVTTYDIACAFGFDIYKPYTYGVSRSEALSLLKYLENPLKIVDNFPKNANSSARFKRYRTANIAVLEGRFLSENNHEGIKAYKKAIAINPDSAYAKYLLHKLQD